jgi:hypothetical protein
MNKKQLIVAWMIGLFLLFCYFNYCYAELNAYGETQVGFFYGLWDGIKSCVMLPLSVICTNIKVFNLNNTGFMYSLGFFIPALVLCEITIPLLVLAWIIRIAFLLIILLIAALSSARLGR